MLDPSASSQFRAFCISPCLSLGHAIAKASVTSLLGDPRLPLNTGKRSKHTAKTQHAHQETQRVLATNLAYGVNAAEVGVIC